MDLPIHAELISGDKISVPSNEVIFPICQWINEESGHFQILGTGFFVCTDGIFLTAKHVIIDGRGKILPNLFAITFLPGLKFFIRPFNYKNGALPYIKCHERADVAAGHLAPATHNETGVPLTNMVLAVHRAGRDKVMLPGPCYRTSLTIPSGASGGPVTNQHGRVVGINSTGWDGQEISYVSRIEEALELVFDDVQTSGGSKSMSLREMAELG